MARALWKGAINFGLVHIPISMWKATRPQDIHFRMLHEKDLVPVKQKKVCPADGKEVSADELVKGYEVSKGEFVAIDPEEMEALEPDNSHSIDIEDFVELAQVDPIYYETAYYLAPEKGAAKPYSLLVAAMEESGKAAIARFVMRTKQHLVIMRPMGNAIGLSTLYYADEVVAVDDVPAIPKKTSPTNQELEMAVRLVESMSKDFDPDRYEDTYREKVIEMLEKKAKGAKIKIPSETRQQPAKVIDLVSALQASLGGGSPEKTIKPTAKNTTPKKAKTASKKKSAA